MNKEFWTDVYKGRLLRKLEPRTLAFRWKTLWKPGSIIAVVIDHVFMLNPSDSVAAISIKSLGLPCLIIAQWICGTAGWRSRYLNTSICIEVSVRNSEWGKCPISLNTAALCSPVICIPQAAIDSHGLVLWVRYSIWFLIVEYSYWYVVHQESGLNKFPEKN